MRHGSTSLARSDPPKAIDAAWIGDRLATILDLEQVEPDDDFFELGGDSTAAVALLSEIEARSGLRLEIAVLLDAPTPRRLAAHIDGGGRRKHPLLLPVEETGAGIPLFLVHGLLGQIFLARHLKGHLGERPIWGIQAAAQDPRKNAPRPIESLAEDYVAAIRTVRPAGPYLIGGYCAGSFIAWEMAQRLKVAGERVPLVFAIDPPPFVGDRIGGPTPEPGSAPMADRRFLARAQLNIRRTGFHHADYHWIRDDKAAQRQAVATAAALRHAFLAYRPEPYDGSVVFLCSANKARLIRSKDSPWHTLVNAKPRIEKLAGRHTDLFIPHDPTLGTAMKRAIDTHGL
jgi:thioesterase domain-containing protein/acyl carrier protein